MSIVKFTLILTQTRSNVWQRPINAILNSFSSIWMNKGTAKAAQKILGDAVATFTIAFAWTISQKMNLVPVLSQIAPLLKSLTQTGLAKNVSYTRILIRSKPNA